MAAKTTRKRTATIYCKVKDRTAQTEKSIGVEIAESRKDGKNGDAYLLGEGRVMLRFFDTSLPRVEDQIRVMLEPWEAYDLYLAAHDAVKSRDEKGQEKAFKHEITHRFMRQKDGKPEETLKTVCVEKWINGERTGFAIKASQKGGRSHNVSTKRTNLLFAAEFLKFLATLQSWGEVPVPD